MATPIKKGVECFMFHSWDGLATMAFRRVVVDSWGKKHGTAHHVSNGKMCKHRIYVQQLHADGQPIRKRHGFECIVPVADVADPYATGMDFAVEYRQNEIESLRDQAQWNHYEHAYNWDGLKERTQKAIDSDCCVLNLDA